MITRINLTSVAPEVSIVVQRELVSVVFKSYAWSKRKMRPLELRAKTRVDDI